MSDTLHIVCSSCNAVNRIPTGRIADRPICGKCHAAVFSGSPIDLDGSNFDIHVQRSDIAVLVDFWAPWCGPCKMMAPQFIEAARELEPNLRLAKVNTESEQGLGSRFSIRSIPTMVLFRKGREIARQAGAMGAAEIVSWAKKQLA